MTSEGPASEGPASRARSRIAGCALILACGLLVSGAAPIPVLAPAPAPYPFEGTWIRADRPCTPRATLVRTYTAREVTSSRNQCAIRRVVGGSGGFELVQDCRRTPAKVTETIRVLSPDLITLKRQVKRLKIPRAIRYARCTAAAPGPNKPR